jgi:5'-methylthioadenosine phosphorylase
LIKVGLIGGTGLEKLNIFKDCAEKTIDTPFGPPSSSLFSGTIGSSEVLILSRHGRQHTIPPTQVNNRANIYALKQLGCNYIITTAACGSLREEIGIGDIVFPDQLLDFTRHRISTFYDHFEPGQIFHVSMAEPFHKKLREYLIDAAEKLEIRSHSTGTIVTIEGPRFSTRAESRMFQLLGGDIINMSVAPEVILANEAKIPYAVIALSTDYDAWRHGDDSLSWEAVVKVFEENVHRVTTLLVHVLQQIQS